LFRKYLYFNLFATAKFQLESKKGNRASPSENNNHRRVRVKISSDFFFIGGLFIKSAKKFH